MPRIAIRSWGSFRKMLRIPNAMPINAGKTKSNALIALSAVKDKPESEDSNRVRRTSNKTDSANKAMDFVAKLSFI